MLKVLVLACVLIFTPLIAIAADPTGAATGGASDIVASNPSAPTLQEVAAEVGHSKVASNFVWMLLAGFLVMFMQAGFAFCETGFTRAKNASHTMAMNMMVYGIGLLGYWVCGYALQMGGIGAVAALGNTGALASEYTITIAGHSFGLFGTKGFFLSGDAYDVSVFGLFLFSMVFMDTAATIPGRSAQDRESMASCDISTGSFQAFRDM